jgi:PKD repeat protein
MGTLNTILWNFQNANFNSSSVLSPSVIYNSSGLHTATLTVTNIYGSITRTTNIRVWPSPTISINNSSVCLGQSLTLQPSGAFTYTFQGNSSVVSPSTSTSYSIIGTSSNGCVCSYPASVQITVWQVPNISVAPNKSLVCIGESYSLVASGCNTYTWNSGAQGNQANFIAQQQAVNTVSCTDINGCMTSTQFKIITSFCSGYLSNGIVNHENEFDVTISNGVMHLTSTYSKVVKIELYDSGGKLVYKRQIDGDFHEIDLNEFSKGVYFLQLNSDNAFLRKKVCYCEE